MQPLDRHRKRRVGLIVKTDTVEYKKADGYVGWNLGRLDLSVFADELLISGISQPTERCPPKAKVRGSNPLGRAN